MNHRERKEKGQTPSHLGNMFVTSTPYAACLLGKENQAEKRKRTERKRRQEMNTWAEGRHGQCSKKQDAIYCASIYAAAAAAAVKAKCRQVRAFHQRSAQAGRRAAAACCSGVRRVVAVRTVECVAVAKR